jgi:hypothetical protein
MLSYSYLPLKILVKAERRALEVGFWALSLMSCFEEEEKMVKGQLHDWVELCSETLQL